MAKRAGPSDGAVSLLLFVLFLIPLAIYYIFKWVFAGIAAVIGSFGGIKYGSTKNLDMSQVDAMDGIEFENFVAALLRENGYMAVRGTKASGDYGVDITAKKNGIKYAFQCKCYSSNLGVKPVQEVFSGIEMYQAEKAVVVTNAYFTRNAGTLAERLGVELWDRDSLMRMMGKVTNLPNLQGAKADETQKTEKETVNITEPGVNIESPGLFEEIQSNEWGADGSMATIIGAGKYVFGKNIPYGIYDLFAVEGSGGFRRITHEGENEWVYFGTEERDAKEYRGLDSADLKEFALSGSVKAEIKRAVMIEGNGEYVQQRTEHPVKTDADRSSDDSAESAPQKERDPSITVIGDGKYVSGTDIPLGKYDLFALSGSGILHIQTGKGREDWVEICFGVEKNDTKMYRNLSLPSGWYFAIQDGVEVQITRSKMLEIN